MDASTTQAFYDSGKSLFDKGFGLVRRVGENLTHWPGGDSDEVDSADTDVPARPESEKTFRVFVLGTSGSGKTTFLASMYKRLSVQHPDVGFYLHADVGQGKILTRKYQQLADPEEDWPAGTLRSEVSDWRFTCTHVGEGGSVDVFKISYLDYAGESLTESLDGQDFEPGSEAQKADSVLVLLDGQKVLRFMDGRSGGYLGSLEHDLDYLLPTVQKLHAKPLHFVVSKWDVVEDRYSLAEIRRKLLGHEQFKVIINRRRERGVAVRLIPVSALGSGFAALDESGFMVKRRDAGAPSPYQVELSIAGTLIDHFQAAARRLSAEEQEILLNPRRLMGVPAGVGRSAIWALKHLATVLPSLGEFRIGAVVLSALLSGLDEKLSDWSDDIKREFEQALAKVEGESAAVDAIVLKNLVLIKVLDAEHPGSNLLHV